MSKVEKVMNKIILILLLIEFALSLIIALCGAAWYSENFPTHGYLEITSSVAYTTFINFFSYFLLLSTLIPISLIVTLEIGKVIMSLFIMGDARMYSLER